MSPVFDINFRREAWRQQRAITRQRALRLGVWVGYFGLLALVLGLYGLNCSALARRARLLEAQNARLRAAGGLVERWKPGAEELRLVEGALANPRRWQRRLVRLAELLPAHARLTSVAVNPDNLSDPAEREKLVIRGVMRPVPGRDLMPDVMALVARLHDDPEFAAGARDVRLAESRILGGPGAPAEFRIECR